MRITGNQKEIYLENYRTELIHTFQDFEVNVLPEQIENLVQNRKTAIENSLKNGIDVGGLYKWMVYPFDIVYVEDSEKIASDFYYIVEENGREKLYAIKF